MGWCPFNPINNWVDLGLIRVNGFRRANRFEHILPPLHMTLTRKHPKFHCSWLCLRLMFVWCHLAKLVPSLQAFGKRIFKWKILESLNYGLWNFKVWSNHGSLSNDWSPEVSHNLRCQMLLTKYHVNRNCALLKPKS